MKLSPFLLAALTLNEPCGALHIGRAVRTRARSLGGDKASGAEAKPLIAKKPRSEHSSGPSHSSDPSPPPARPRGACRQFSNFLFKGCTALITLGLTVVLAGLMLVLSVGSFIAGAFFHPNKLYIGTGDHGFWLGKRVQNLFPCCNGKKSNLRKVEVLESPIIVPSLNLERGEWNHLAFMTPIPDDQYEQSSILCEFAVTAYAPDLDKKLPTFLAFPSDSPFNLSALELAQKHGFNRVKSYNFGQAHAHVYFSTYDIVIAIQGSLKFMDFVVDAEVARVRPFPSNDFSNKSAPGNVHMGFWTDANTLWPAIRKDIMKHQNANTNLLICGHSLGAGAAAVLAAFAIQDDSVHNPRAVGEACDFNNKCRNNNVFQ